MAQKKNVENKDIDDWCIIAELVIFLVIAKILWIKMLNAIFRVKKYGVLREENLFTQ
jgi:hypothetical protein